MRLNATPAKKLSIFGIFLLAFVYVHVPHELLGANR